MVTLQQECNAIHTCFVLQLSNRQNPCEGICMINSESLSSFSHSHCLLLKQETFVLLQIIKCGSLTGGLIFLQFYSLKVIVKMNGSLLVLPFIVSCNCYIYQQKEAEVHLCALHSKGRMAKMSELKTGPKIKALIFQCRIFLKHVQSLQTFRINT